MDKLDGVVLVGWILATIAVAGLYGAVRNEKWLSVMTRVVKPSSPPQRIK